MQTDEIKFDRPVVFFWFRLQGLDEKLHLQMYFPPGISMSGTKHASSSTALTNQMDLT